MDGIEEKIGAHTDPRRLTYIRLICDAELADLPNEALEAICDPEALYVLTSAEGEKLAIVEGREQAFAAAAANRLIPVSVH